MSIAAVAWFGGALQTLAQAIDVEDYRLCSVASDSGQIISLFSAIDAALLSANAAVQCAPVTQAEIASCTSGSTNQYYSVYEASQVVERLGDQISCTTIAGDPIKTLVQGPNWSQAQTQEQAQTQAQGQAQGNPSGAGQGEQTHNAVVALIVADQARDLARQNEDAVLQLELDVSNNSSRISSFESLKIEAERAALAANNSATLSQGAADSAAASAAMAAGSAIVAGGSAMAADTSADQASSSASAAAASAALAAGSASAAAEAANTAQLAVVQIDAVLIKILDIEDAIKARLEQMVLAKGSRGLERVSQVVFFDIDDYSLDQNAFFAIQAILNADVPLDTALFVLTGYADTLGSSAYNDNLSLLRVSAVRDALKSVGVSTDQIAVSNVGEKLQRSVTGDNVAEQQNRATVIQVYY